MKKLLKAILPAVLFLAFGIFLMFAVSACTKGSCKSCTSNSDCPEGTKCYTFSSGGNKCAESVGSVCPAF